VEFQGRSLLITLAIVVIESGIVILVVLLVLVLLVIMTVISEYELTDTTCEFVCCSMMRSITTLLHQNMTCAQVPDDS